MHILGLNYVLACWDLTKVYIVRDKALYIYPPNLWDLLGCFLPIFETMPCMPYTEKHCHILKYYYIYIVKKIMQIERYKGNDAFESLLGLNLTTTLKHKKGN